MDRCWVVRETSVGNRNGWLGQHPYVVALGLVVGGTLAKAIYCFFETGGLGTAFANCFFPLAVVALLAGLVLSQLLFGSRQDASLGRRYAKDWKAICHVLESEHVHDGTQLRGTWSGRPFQASAIDARLSQYEAIQEYVVRMRAERQGPAWQASRKKQVPGKDLEPWRVHADKRSTEEALLSGGLLQALQAADHQAEYVRPGARLFYDPSENEVVFRVQTGSVPSGHDLLVHLALVHRAVDVHASLDPAATAEAKRTGRIRPRLRTDLPPFWVCALWLPTAWVLVVSAYVWPGLPPWTFALLPASCVLPYAWRLRIGRH